MVQPIGRLQFSMGTDDLETAPGAIDSPKLSSKCFSIEQVIRNDLLILEPRQPFPSHDKTAARLNRPISSLTPLCFNENPYGPLPVVQAAIAASAPSLNAYAATDGEPLRTQLAEYVNAPSECIVIGAGEDELIHQLVRLCVVPGSDDAVVDCPPCFHSSAHAALASGATLLRAPRRAGDLLLDVAAVERHFVSRPTAPPKIVFVASPSNPDGSLLAENDLARLLRLPALIVVDEAYFEFAQTTFVPLVKQHNNLAVLRTFSKWAGLCSARVGYGVFPRIIADNLVKIKVPHNVCRSAMAAAEASLVHREQIMGYVRRLLNERSCFYKRMQAFPWITPMPSNSNFVLCRVGGGRNARQVCHRLEDRGILVKSEQMEACFGIGDCFRVSMGTQQQMERLYSALEDL